MAVLSVDGKSRFRGCGKQAGFSLGGGTTVGLHRFATIGVGTAA